MEKYNPDQSLLLDAGSGGRATQRLISDLFLAHFANELLTPMDDAALLPSPPGQLALSTDSYTVSPIFFPGGSIGSLAVHGTVNDVAMLGAKPLWLTCAFILEEGLLLGDLEKIVKDMAGACKNSGVKIVTGDTKVVPAGACDKIFITTTGIGHVIGPNPPSGHKARPGDVIIVSGEMGDHGLTIMGARENVSFLASVSSDSAPLAQMIESLIMNVGVPHTLRDPTRGGLATTLNEIAQQSNVCIEIEERNIPVNQEVAAGCSFLGLDPLYLANEGKCIFIMPPNLAEAALEEIKASPYGKKAAVIGKVTETMPGSVIMRTPIGGQRILPMLEGAQLPRIC